MKRGSGCTSVGRVQDQRSMQQGGPKNGESVVLLTLKSALPFHTPLLGVEEETFYLPFQRQPLLYPYQSLSVLDLPFPYSYSKASSFPAVSLRGTRNAVCTLLRQAARSTEGQRELWRVSKRQRPEPFFVSFFSPPFDRSVLVVWAFDCLIGDGRRGV